MHFSNLKTLLLAYKSFVIFQIVFLFVFYLLGFVFTGTASEYVMIFLVFGLSLLLGFALNNAIKLHMSDDKITRKNNLWINPLVFTLSVNIIYVCLLVLSNIDFSSIDANNNIKFFTLISWISVISLSYIFSLNFTASKERGYYRLRKKREKMGYSNSSL